MAGTAPVQTDDTALFAPPFYFGRWAGDDGAICGTRNVMGTLAQFRVDPADARLQCPFYREWWYVAADGHDGIRRGFIEPLRAIGDRILAHAAAVRTGPAPRMRDADALLWTLFLVSLRRRPGEGNGDEPDAPPAAVAGLAEAGDGTAAAGAPRYPEAPAVWHPVQRVARQDFRPVDGVTDLPLEVAAIRPLLLREWYLLNLAGTPYLLLTSDRPCVQTGALDDPEGIVYLPLTPTLGFFALAAGSYVKRALLAVTDARRLAAALNAGVAGQALRHVYSRDADDMPAAFLRTHVPFDLSED